MPTRNQTTDRITRFGKKVGKELDALKKKPFVKCGFPQKSFQTQHGKKVSVADILKHVVGTKKLSDRPLTVGEIAICHEFGTIHIPERSFLRSTHDEQWNNWFTMTDKLRKQIMKGDMTVKKALGLLGMQITQDFRKKIRSNIRPPLAASTLKGKTRGGKVGNIALIDTAQMLNSLTYVRVNTD